jgi:hypothetical protein
MARRKLIASGGRFKQSYGRCSGTPDVPHEEHLAEKLHAYTRRYADDRPSSGPRT